MGGGSWNKSLYEDRAAVRSARVSSGGSAFAYDHAVKTGTAARKVHADMDPKRVAGPASPFAGKVMRESCDSADHPESLAIVVLFDVTGSMGRVPVTLVSKLGGLMSLLIQKGYVAHPQLLFGANGDAYKGDQGPLQVGQFESGIEMEGDLDKIWIEGQGGGGGEETYDLGLYFIDQHTAIDCWTKRQKKGYLFTVGDEAPYNDVRKADVHNLIGDTLRANESTKDIVTRLKERYHVFHIIAEDGGYPHNQHIEDQWKALVGPENVLKLEDSSNVAELIATTIGLNEGTTDIDTAADHLKDMGVSASAIRSVTAALVPLAASGALTKGAVKGNLPDVSGGGSTVRL